MECIMTTMKGTKQREYKQTFVNRNCYVRRRDVDGMWQVIRRMPDPQFDYDKWKGGRNSKGAAIKPYRWVCVDVVNDRETALQRARGNVK